MFDVLLVSSLFVLYFGFCYRVSAWFLRAMPCQNRIPGRFVVFLSGVLSIFSRKNFLTAFRSFIFEVFCQKRLLQNNIIKGTVHLVVSGGILILIFMHAMDGIVMGKIFPNYMSTLNPFFFLRDFIGFLVLAGLLFFLLRRVLFAGRDIKTSKSDLLILIMLISLVGSGFLLEGMKMASVKEFAAMTEDYADLSYDDEETFPLEAYWVKDFGLVSQNVPEEISIDIIQTGFELHQAYCMDCHSSNKSAFGGYVTAALISPVAGLLDRMNGVTIFYYLHIVICFVCLGLIPFTKLFHMFATPVSLITRVLVDDKVMKSENRLTRQLMELDACTHCSVCNKHCSARMMYEQLRNDFILPSEKMLALKEMLNGKRLNPSSFEALFQGIYICTNCDRCTVECPSGIDLKEIWINVRNTFTRFHYEKPYILSNFSFLRGLLQSEPNDSEYKKPTEASIKELIPKADPGEAMVDLDLKTRSSSFFSLLSETHTFSNCYGCQDCSMVCPVVKTYESPGEELILMPHQIMYCLGLGLMENASHSAMTWNCLSCYQCQECCPQEVSVCDILFALKNNIFNKS